MAKTDTEKTAKGPTTSKPSQRSEPKPKKSGVKAKPKTASEPAASERAPTRSPEERYRMIQDAAYHIAEKDGFKRGMEQDYWLRAEQDIDRMLDNETRQSPTSSKKQEKQDIH